jgi:hypothetical protein
MEKRLQSLAEHLQSLLIDAGFVVHRYDAISTCSIYLKMDFGLVGSLRVSDHPGKKHLEYSFEIGPHIKAHHKKQGSFGKWMRYYPADGSKKLLRHVQEVRKERENAAGGPLEYFIQMQELDLNRHNKKGFWQGARRVGG